MSLSPKGHTMLSGSGWMVLRGLFWFLELQNPGHCRILEHPKKQSLKWPPKHDCAVLMNSGRRTHPLESDRQHHDGRGHVHGFQRWPLSIRYAACILHSSVLDWKPNRKACWLLVVSAEVEMTAYGLLTYTLLGDVASALPVVKWLSQQRNSLGGFSSTQVGEFVS